MVCLEVTVVMIGQFQCREFGMRLCAFIVKEGKYSDFNSCLIKGKSDKKMFTIYSIMKKIAIFNLQ